MSLRKCVSFGNLGQGALSPGATTFSDPTTDIYGPGTTDRYTNITFVQDTSTKWVRLFVVWPFVWPNPPAQTIDASHPYFVSAENRAQVIAQVEDLNANINAAKKANKRVILTTAFFPQWTNGKPNNQSEPNVSNQDKVMPPDSVLMLPNSKPPNGSSFQPSDFAYYWWVYTLMNLYHHGRINRPANDPAQGASIDAFELVNEPNLYFNSIDSQGTLHRTNLAALAHSTALMMRTAKFAKTQLNQMYKSNGKSPLYLLGPALAQVGPWKTFARNVINDLLAMYGSNGIKTLADREFGWAHHNYGDVEKIGQRLQSVNAAFDTARPVVAEATKAKSRKAIAPNLYGTGTQTLRTILKGKWKGWADSGDPDPTIFLTEGGASLERLPGFVRDHPRPDPNAHYNASGQRTSNPAAMQKQLQAYSVGGAAVALQRRHRAGQGVEMFTNFLCFDDNGSNFSGLCDLYALYRGSPPYPRGAQTMPQPEANLPAKDYERPSYTTWKNFNLSNIPRS